MKRQRSHKKQDVKKLTERLLRQELGDCPLGIWFKGWWEDFDLRLRMLLKEEPPDYADRWYRVHQTLRKAGFDVLMGKDLWDELEEEEKQDWQSLWQPVSVKKSKAKVPSTNRMSP
jgi:hypothetical protein